MDKTDDNKIILKRSELPGIDMSLVDLEIVGTVKVRVSIIKKKMYTIKGKTFIGTRDQLDNMDVIQLGNFGIKYRVMSLEKMTDYEGYIYRIKRLDGHNTTELDINATAVGQKFKIVNRQSFEQLFAYACSMREEIPIPTTVDLSKTLACEGCGVKTTQSHPTVSTPVPPDPEPEDPCTSGDCITYSFLSILGSFGDTFEYLDCLGNTVVWDINVDSYINFTEGAINIQVCGVAGQTFEGVAYDSGKGKYIVTAPTCTGCELEPLCKGNTVVSIGASITSLYMKCDGNIGIVEVIGADIPQATGICIKEGSEYVHLGSMPSSIIETGNC